MDVVNIGSTLQYVRNYSDLLDSITEKTPRFILLTDYYMGEAETYATKQVNIPGLVIPLWIFHLKEIKNIITSKGYKYKYYYSK